jgi:hypothetical protein
MDIYVIIFIIIIILWIFLIFKYKKRYKLSPTKKIFFHSHLKKILNYNSYKWQIIDLDKLYHKILLEAWYEWTFWEILKKEPSEIENLNKIWELHKVRNKLVHDFDSGSDNLLKDYCVNYVIETKKLLNKF